ncbi:MAG: biopolymer transporter ExbD [Spirochaetes bacterium]|nr:biopolymer transporter ExbD [Spirochaetota bacterium]
MKIRNKKRRMPIILVSSMSDIAFLLLIFIILLSLINYKKEIKIDYPEAEYQEKTQTDKNFEIWIDKEGVTYYKGRAVNLSSLKNLVSDRRAKNIDTRFHIIADKNTEYKNVNKVIEVLKIAQAGVVSLVVKDNEKK